MANYEQPKSQSFTDDYTNGDYTADESRMMMEEQSAMQTNQQNPSAPPMMHNGEEGGQNNDGDDMVMVDHDGEEHVDVEAGEFEDEADEDDDFMKGELYEYEVGALNCLWRPARPHGCREFMHRCGGWLALNREQIASGITVGVTQIPEVCSSALMAGINPIRALQATWIMNVVTSVMGGRPGMVSGTSGFVGLALLKLVEEHGVDYIFYAIMFAGVIELAFGLMGLGALFRLIPNPLMVGFVNGMGLLIAAQQFRYAKVWPDQAFHSEPLDRRDLIAVGHSYSQFTDKDSEWIETSSFIVFIVEALVCFLVCLFLPKATKIIPSTFVALIVGVIAEWAIVRQIGYNSPIVEDYADISSTFPKIVWNDPKIDMPSFSWDTFQKIYLAGLAVFGVGLIESILTANVLNDRIGNNGFKSKIAISQGVANIVTSVFGGMGGSGMLSQSIVANKAYGITGLSTFLTGVTLLVIIVAASPAVKFIPLAAFAGIMFYIAFCNLIQWGSILNGIAALFPERVRDWMRLDYKIQRSDILIMLFVTVMLLIFDLTVAIVGGVLIAVFVYVWDSSNRVVVDRELSEDGMNVTYNISGPLFFATAQSFLDTFPAEEIEHDPEDVILLLEGAEVFDSSGMVALKKLHDRFEALGKVAALSSLSPTSRRIMEKSASMWEGVSFLEVEEIDEDELESIPSKIGPHNDL
mmetsp:Transcript_34634/g.69967  ORF Transcript_34634/g.69967 Transcript_34634/m.69967 type:complete len:694 (+) Transcript_34634:544-2625(+)